MMLPDWTGPIADLRRRVQALEIALADERRERAADAKMWRETCFAKDRVIGDIALAAARERQRVVFEAAAVLRAEADRTAGDMRQARLDGNLVEADRLLHDMDLVRACAQIVGERCST